MGTRRKGTPLAQILTLVNALNESDRTTLLDVLKASQPIQKRQGKGARVKVSETKDEGAKGAGAS